MTSANANPFGDGYAHQRDFEGFCANCGAGPGQAHTILPRRKSDPTVGLRPGDKVTSRKLGPGVWEVTAAYESVVAVTKNGIHHIRPTEWFKPATRDDI